MDIQWAGSIFMPISETFFKLGKLLSFQFFLFSLRYSPLYCVVFLLSNRKKKYIDIHSAVNIDVENDFQIP